MSDTPTQAAALPDLLPCPFCGHQTARSITSASELAAEDEDEDYEPYPHSETWAVICDASEPNGPGGCGASGGFKPSEAEAVAAWNSRVIAAQAQELDALRAEVDLARKLHWLAAHDYVFMCSYNETIKDWDDGAHPAINCNDVFYPASDAESLKPEHVDAYVTLCQEFKDDAALAWCSVVRNNLKPWRGSINEAALKRANELFAALGDATKETPNV